MDYTSNKYNNDSDAIQMEITGSTSSKTSLKRNDNSQQTKEPSKKKKPKVFGQITNLRGHSKPAFVNAWNPVISNLLASGAGDGTAIIWTLKTNENTPQFENLGDSKQVILDHKNTDILNTETTDSKGLVANFDVTTLCWNKDGLMLATGCFDGHARIWTLSGELHKVLDGHNAPIVAVKWSPSSKFLLTGSLDGTVIVWDTESGKIISKFAAHKGSVLEVAWRCDNIFATCSTDSCIAIWSVSQTISPLYKLMGHKGEINTISWHSSGKLLASGSDDSSAKVWEFVNDSRLNIASNNALVNEGGEMIEIDPIIVNHLSNQDKEIENADVRVRTLLGHEQQVYVVEWLPNVENAILATGSFDGSVRIWDAKTGENIRTLFAHNDPIHAIAFSPDGRQLITGSFDCFVNLWSLKNGLLIRSFMADDGIYDVRFSNSGRIAASVANGSIVVLDSKA
ncbi:hypothetical protein BB561_001565 [Smittium simulii]|uniref:Uncharacterized protein n=1 Tax=Smittium simulii TaxID=133385 RepID=A0A2T9YU57_9FUNG|nr:hypothetical protein BB561_001565 [Smittium simulii]